MVGVCVGNADWLLVRMGTAPLAMKQEFGPANSSPPGRVTLQYRRRAARSTIRYVGWRRCNQSNDF
jgi:hypothetical protein